jgi:hypothetical protein
MNGTWRWYLPAHGISGINSRENRNLSRNQPVYQRELNDANNGNERPDKKFAGAQTALINSAEPELEFGRTENNDIAIAKQSGLDRLSVDSRKRIRGCSDNETLLPLKFQTQVLIPNAVVFKLQIICICAPDVKRKTADNRLAARLFS